MADANLIKKTDLTDAQVREIEFANKFGYSLKKLTEALGVTRKVAKQAGIVLKTYTASGELEDGAVAEGETIPLSKYTLTATAWSEITLKKWRKATTAEAILDKGIEQAEDETTDAMIIDVQKSIRKGFFDFIKTGSTAVSGTTLQATIAQTWGKLQVLFEDDAIETVYFINPVDVANYLATAQVTTQTAFGMTYIENFLGMGTVFLNSSVEVGKVYATAKENLILYYVPANESDLAEAFSFTTDETGLIGIHTTSDYNNLTSSTTVISGVVLMAEKLDGIVVGTITPAVG